MATPGARAAAAESLLSYSALGSDWSSAMPSLRAVVGGRGRRLAMQTMSNTLLCDTAVTPDGCVMVIEDVGTRGNSGTYVHADLDCEAGVAWDALWVHTMSDHECDVVGRAVRVRVFSGSDSRGLGVRVFDGELNVASGILALGHRHNRGRQLLCGAASIVRLTVFAGHSIEAIQFEGSDAEYPVSGPSEVNLLLHGDPAFVPVVSRPRAQWH